MIPPIDPERLTLVLLALAMVGFVYDRLVARMNAITDGYVPFQVVVGTLATLAGFALLAGLEMALLALACFAASGFFMVLGSVRRHLEKLERRQAASQDKDLIEDILEQTRS